MARTTTTTGVTVTVALLFPTPRAHCSCRLRRLWYTSTARCRRLGTAKSPTRPCRPTWLMSYVVVSLTDRWVLGRSRVQIFSCKLAVSRFLASSPHTRNIMPQPLCVPSDVCNQLLGVQSLFTVACHLPYPEPDNPVHTPILHLEIHFHIVL